MCVEGDLLLDVVSQALGALANGTIVNGVATDRIHPSSPAAGAKGNGRPKGIFQGGPFLGEDVLGHLGRIIGEIRLGEPGSDVGGSGRSDFSGGRSGLQRRQGILIGVHAAIVAAGVETKKGAFLFSTPLLQLGVFYGRQTKEVLTLGHGIGGPLGAKLFLWD